MTVADSILDDLRQANGGWVCGNTWYGSHRPTFAQRISLDLKPRGFVIESEPCPEPMHYHRGPIHRYRLLVDPERPITQAPLF